MKKIGVVGSKEVNTVVNEEGEVISQDTQNILVNKYIYDGETFLLLYNSFITDIRKFDKISEKVFLHMCMNAKSGSMEVIMTKSFKIGMVVDLGFSLGTINNSIQRLYRMDALRRIDTGVYLVNPAYAWKGSGSKRSDGMDRFLKLDSFFSPIFAEIFGSSKALAFKILF